MTTFTATMVSIDDFGPFPALVEDGRRWNGFAYAWFTRETLRDMANRIAAEVRDPSIDPWIEVTDVGFMEHGDDGPYDMERMTVDGVDYWTMGGGWCWLEVGEFDDDGLLLCGSCGQGLSACDCDGGE